MNRNPLRAAGAGLLLLALSLVPPAGAEVYRCQRDGQMVFTDQACSGGAALALPAPVVVTPEDDRLARAHDRREAASRQDRDAADSAWLAAHRERQLREDGIRSARIAGVAVEGMTAADVRQALGEPDKVSASDSGERWTYKLDGGARRVVSFRAGTVAAVTVADAAKRKRR
jgi:hypothetical protein